MWTNILREGWWLCCKYKQLWYAEQIHRAGCAPRSVSPQLHRQIVIEQLWPLIFSLFAAHLCMTAGHCKWPHWTPDCWTLWPHYLLEGVANLTAPGLSPQLFDRSTTHPVCFFICNQHFCLFLYLFLHHLPKFKLTFSSIPTITSHLHPITSNDNACQGKLFREVSPSALHFSIKLPHWLICLTVQGYNSSLHSLAMLLSSTDTAFCFIQAIFFLNWQRAPREVESESDHITQTCFCVEAGSRQPQALHLKICKKKVSGRSLGDGVVVLACSPSTLYMFSYFTEMHVGLIFSVQ